MIILSESNRIITSNFEIEKKVFGYDWLITGGNPVTINGAMYQSGVARSSGICNSCDMILKMKLSFVFDPNFPSEVVLTYYVHE
jgi:hypothetical protein